MDSKTTIEEQLAILLKGQQALIARSERIELRLNTVTGPERCLRTNDAAQMLGVSRQQIQRWCACGAMDCTRQGAKGMLRFSLEQINRMADKLKGKA